MFITNDNTHDPSITFKKNYELNGCKYLNLELSSPNSGELTVRLGLLPCPTGNVVTNEMVALTLGATYKF